MPKHKPIKFETTLEPSIKKSIERIIRENQMAKNILHATLGIIALGGMITVGTAFPALISEIGKMKNRRKRESYKQYQQIWHSFNSLKKERAVEFIEEKDGCLIYKINKKGEEKIRTFIFDEIKIAKPKEWDQKWRLVIFDIPEYKRKERVALRIKLKDLGFFQCQKSAWIYPFSCEEEIEFAKDTLGIKPFVKIFLVEKMDDGKVLYHFRELIKSIVLKP